MVAGEIAHRLIEQLGLFNTIIVVVFLPFGAVWGTVMLAGLIQFFYQCVPSIGLGCDL